MKGQYMCLCSHPEMCSSPETCILSQSHSAFGSIHFLSLPKCRVLALICHALWRSFPHHAHWHSSWKCQEGSFSFASHKKKKKNMLATSFLHSTYQLYPGILRSHKKQCTWNEICRNLDIKTCDMQYKGLLSVLQWEFSSLNSYGIT